MWKVITAAALLLVGSQITWAQRGGAPDFDALDTDDSGALDLEEVTAMFAAFGGMGGAPEPAQIFADWDADGDESISREEFDGRPRRGGGMGGGMGG